MDTGSFIVYIKTKDSYVNIAKDVRARFDTSNYELERPFPKETHKKVIGLKKDELGGKIMTELPALRSKIYRYLTNNNDKNKANDTKK